MRQRERCCCSPFFSPLSFLYPARISFLTSLFRSRAKSFLDLSIEGFLVNSRPRIIPRIITVLVVVVVLGYSRHSRGGILLAQMTMSLSCTTLHVVLPPTSYSRSCRTKSGRREKQKAVDERHIGNGTAWRCTRAREQPSLTELLPLRSLHSREAVVYAPRHPTDAELMILINVS